MFTDILKFLPWPSQISFGTNAKIEASGVGLTITSTWGGKSTVGITQPLLSWQYVTR